jgi:hypothetical protein
MDPVVLKNKTPEGKILEATFLPEKGMNMISYKLDDLQVIDQSTKALFDERFAGLGALIGPHFHHRNISIIPIIKDENLFPHIARIKAKGIQEPFSHGIARYAPWKDVTATETKLNAILSGKDIWNGISLAELEGQNFKISFIAEMTPYGLQIDLSIASDADSVVGIHYYWHLPKGKGKITSSIKEFYMDQNERKSIPENWDFNSQHLLNFDLHQEADFTFYPFPKALEAKILLDAEIYKLEVQYTSPSQENCWQLYHPINASFVCIEPISSQDPRHPNLTASSLKINLEIKV